MKRFARFLLVWLFFVTTASAWGPALAAIRVEPSDPHLVYVGRFSKDYRCGWTGSAIRLRCEATSVSAQLSITRNKEVAVQVVLDGRPTQTIVLKPESVDYELASDLPAGPHTIELVKRTEASMGELKFEGFTLSDGAKLLPLPAVERRILVIGDSITCGFANEAASVSEQNSVTNENGYLAYGPLAARELRADLTMICWSGRGIYRNYNGEPDPNATMPGLFERQLPLDPKSSFDPKQFVPQVIVINLGTNDRRDIDGQRPALTPDMYLPPYRQFIGRLHEWYPEARIIVSIGPMVIEPISDWLVELERDYPFVHRLVFDRYRSEAERGGRSHPSLAGHERMAQTLAEKIREIMGW